MPNVPDYSQYIGVKKVGVAQTANTNGALLKGRAPNRFDGYFPLYKSIRLPANSLISNKFLGSAASTAPSIPFAPSDIATLRLWLDATDLTNGASVTTWSDKALPADNFTASGTTPTVTQLAGRNYVNTTSGGYFSSPNTFTASYSIFIVAYTTANTLNTVMSSQNTPVLLIRSNTSTLSAYNGNGSIFNNVLTNGNVTAPSIIEFIHDNSGGGAKTLYSTGNLQASGTGNAIAPIGLGIGERLDASSSWNGYIGEVLWYTDPLITADRQKVEGYMAWKWGLVPSLPIGHPYKSAAP